MDNLLIYAIIAVVVILILIVAALLILRPQEDGQAASKSKQVNKGWQELARRTSLKYTPPDRSSEGANVRGYYQGYPVTLRLRLRTALGRDTQTIVTYTRIELGMKNQARIYARMYRKGAFKQTDRAFGVPNVIFGIPELDNRFDVKSSPAEFIPRAIANRKQIYQLLLAVHTEHNVGIEIEGDGLVFEEQGVEASPDYLQPILDLLVEFAQAVEQGK
jgi:hypothetical protein